MTSVALGTGSGAFHIARQTRVSADDEIRQKTSHGVFRRWL